MIKKRHPIYVTSLLNVVLALVCVIVLVPIFGFTKKKKRGSSTIHNNIQKPLKFSIKDESGSLTDIGKLKGKVVFLNLWALSCPPCKTELPSINGLYNHFKDNANVAIYSISLDYNFANVGAYMKQNSYSLKVYSPNGAIPEFFNGIIPTTVVIDKQGQVAFHKEEEQDYSTTAFINYIDSLAK